MKKNITFTIRGTCPRLINDYPFSMSHENGGLALPSTTFTGSMAAAADDKPLDNPALSKRRVERNIMLTTDPIELTDPETGQQLTEYAVAPSGHVVRQSRPRIDVWAACLPFAYNDEALDATDLHTLLVAAGEGWFEVTEPDPEV